MKLRIQHDAICSLLSILFAYSICAAQSGSHISSVDYAGHHSYDVIEYKLFMDWYGILAGSTNSYFGVMQIRFLPDLVTPLNEIDLDNDTTYLRVDSAFADGKMLRLSITGARLYVTLDKPYLAEDTATVLLYYHVIEQPPDSQRGFYYFYKGEQPKIVQGHPLPSGYTVPYTIAYTMSEPSDAHDWMPCYDDPSDKAVCKISIRVPNGYVAASNGTLIVKVDNHDGSTTFNWAENYPVATYLMCVTAAQFSIVERNFTKDDGTTIPIQYYVYPDDSADAVSNSECNVDTIASMIKFYESLYGTFPFDKYGMTGIEPFYYGGMEHQTVTTLLRKYEYNRSVVAHELAHQWWGDMVTLGTWNDIWLNEGFATYSEAMQLQHLDQSEFEGEMQSYENTYFSQTQYAIYAPEAQGAYLFDLAEYYKGAWVLNMLRNIVGDSTFFTILRTYRSDFPYGNAVTGDFINVVNQVTHSDMSWFFNEWIFQPGFPVYSFSYTKEGDSLALYLKQLQTNAPIFKIPVEFAVYSQGQETIVRMDPSGKSFFDSSAIQIFTVAFPAQPDSAVFDPGNKIMKQVVPWSSTGVHEIVPKIFKISESYPNPFNPTTTITYQLPAISHVAVKVYDVVGREVATLVNAEQAAGTYNVTFDGHAFASGVYFCKIATNFGNRTMKLLLEK